MCNRAIVKCLLNIGAIVGSVLSVTIVDTTFASEYGTMKLVDPGSFSEKFSGNTQVSGQLLSGLSYETADNTLDPSAIGVASADGRICVRLTTEDGRYWASNLFESPNGTAGPSFLSFPTAYIAQLKTYPSTGLMVLAARSDDCVNVADKLLVPGIVGGLQDGASLLAYVNVSQGRTTAWLEQNGEPATQIAECHMPLNGARVTYSAICNIVNDQDLLAGEYSLHIAVRSLTGGRIEESYRIVVE